MVKDCRWWFVTMWDMNYDYAALIERGQIKYCYIGGLELTPKTNKEHKHVLMYSHNSKERNIKSFNWLAKHINADTRPWVKDAKGSELEIESYSTKDDPGYAVGDKPTQGMRSDLNLIKDAILKGKTVDEITIESPNIFHQYGRTLSKIEDIALRKKFRTEMTTCTWIHGSTGVGKSHEVFQDYHPDTHYLYPRDNGWWDGYKGQETVIINEFRGEIQYSELLDLIDKWPKTVRRRGREPVPFLAKHIWITSSLPPEEVYFNLAEKDSLEQLKRRCNVVHKKNPEVV